MLKANLTKGSQRALAVKLRSMDLPDGFVMVTLREAGEPILDIMWRLTPVLSGWLRSTEEIFDIAPGVVGIGPNAPHQRFVEFGTDKMDAQPYVRPAYDGGRDEALDVIKESLRLYIRKQAKKR